jgi:putative transposase
MVSSIELETGEGAMVYWSLMHILTFFLYLFTTLDVTSSDKDLEIIILRQQVRILQRKAKSPPRISDPERIILAILTDKISQSTKNASQLLHEVMLIFKPETVLRWHRDLVWRKWTFRRKAKPGMLRISS